ncbi:MAG: response regulator transcription factor [Bacillota bacterium]|nr:response regulator transcription factor [Bacillota bacterium]
MIKVLIADDQTILREGLKFILEQDKDIKVVGYAGNGREAFEQCSTLLPDVVLMDILMPECNGVEGTRMIKEEFPSIKVIILTTFKDDENISSALKKGADGYVLKDIDTEELIFAIKSVIRGLRVMHENAFDVVREKISATEASSFERKNEKKETGLTDREIEVVKLIVYGKSNREIAASLFMSEGTARNVISNILAKLNLKDRTQLAVYAVKNNIV